MGSIERRNAMNTVLLSRLGLWLQRSCSTLTHHPPVQRKLEQQASKKTKRRAPKTIVFFDLP
jgi:hypothetical protein